MRRAVRWVVIGVVAAVVLVVGGTYVYIHFIEGDPPAPLSIDTVTTNRPSADPSSTTRAVADPDGTWTPASGSIVGYRVEEKLFGQSTTAVGRTSDVDGKLVIGGEVVSEASFTVDLTTVKSDRSQRDNQFQGRIMDTARFPTATF